MNVQLVENLVKGMECLNQEERTLLEKKLERKPNWQETTNQIDELQAKIMARRERRWGQCPSYN